MESVKLNIWCLMVNQQVPDIDFNCFVIGELEDLFNQKKILINPQYQRSDIWKNQQKIELIKSIDKRYSIGVLVLFKNQNDDFEILDGQQRLLTIQKFLKDKLELKNTDLKKYSEYSKKDKTLFDAYCVYYLKLKSFNVETREEDITQTFLRLQEGTPLNKAEKINACRGKFKDTFIELRQKEQFFDVLGKEIRFRWRLLAAEILLLELESDFEHNKFPDLNLNSFKSAIKKYETNISERKTTFVKGNLNLLHLSMGHLLPALPPRELLSFYLLMSYLRKNKADNSDLIVNFGEFAKEFLKNLNSFSIYDSKNVSSLDEGLYKKYLKYKTDARQATTPESLESRYQFILEEYKRMCPFLKKDDVRFHDLEQKRRLFFIQKGICPECQKKLQFDSSSTGHHILPHSKGGETEDLDNGILLHKKCHEKLERKLKQEKDRKLSDFSA